MAAADVFAMASRAEPFGLVYVEAMAMRLPVVAFRTGGTPEVVVDGVTGLLSEPDDLERLTNNILGLLDDPELRRRLGAAGRQRVEGCFDTPRLAADVDALYKRLLSAPDERADLALVTA
jgi:glycosyltransferase involved in cell wall biosynthesis